MTLSVVKNNKLYFELSQCIERSFIVCFGVSEIKDHEPNKCYISTQEPYFAVRFHTIDNDRDHCQIDITSDMHVWSGVPTFVKIVDMDHVQYIDISDWIKTYSKNLLIIAYELYETTDIDSLEEIKKVHTHF